ncbi:MULTISPECIES: BrnA antitoxin family protein [unclassified Bosea (in: a-proteobacteria)]|uniref:BrnA antitoxin family protein n=1 Tax=unclassified Bosea (in: a-proteobacteria) TaxID=2653178 RepID=UPI000F753AE6|nr:MULTISPECIES: BrnA antitoxin family protein [unclassified Bosea (in: a-proteobacteria)]AZO80371.1 hypothetical protein BLM15_24460 [Bosea sp. Tri-49]RXT23172.1 hypothetical protein B5U98_11250 [Bosea sp. Tri-39]RXT38643.1 hypothetical protein B5U99_10700 [Bosea sp. Tri-54]
MSTDRTRRPTSARDKAEALFRPAASTAPAAPAKQPTIPGAKELVSLRIDRDVLEHFQSGGSGWQDRMNAVLRRAAGLDSDEA